MPSDPCQSQLLTPARLGWVMDVGETTVASWLSSSKGRPPQITHFRQGRLIRIEPAAVLEFIARNTVRARAGGTFNIQHPTSNIELDWGRIERLITDQVRAALANEFQKAA